LGNVGRFIEGFATYLWPTARIEGLGASAVSGAPRAAAAAFATDDVIDPATTRERLLEVHAVLPTPAAPVGVSGYIDPW
jgi:hypothetical protein